MNLNNIESLKWFQVIVGEIKAELIKLNESGYNVIPALESEKKDLEEKQEGWLLSLSRRDLSHTLRSVLEQKIEEATQASQQIEYKIERLVAKQTIQDQLIDPKQIVERLKNLDEVLQSGNASLVHMELAQHIDKIVCSPDKRVCLRACRLGALTEALPHLTDALDTQLTCSEAEMNDVKVKPRRRARLKTEYDSTREDLESLAYWVSDPNRFEGLDDRWFEEIEFQVPTETSWYQIHASDVFHRRQEAELPYAKLADEFGVTPPTARAAIEYYLDTHPEAKDNVKLQCGGKRPPKFDLSKIGPEARPLWESGWSKLKLAGEFGCSPPTIDKALEWSYAQDGLSMPTKAELQKAISVKARKLLDEGNSLEEISDVIDCSDVTARRYLKMSFEVEGKAMPDLRRKSSGT
ncbi:hypothetical protein [uncultured Gimesia sp.]|uniref:hypothetical protein n=1 Tax=uncultured Gimesia sp. TaxID=1678688 RepID=UPI0030D799E4